MRLMKNFVYPTLTVGIVYGGLYVLKYDPHISGVFCIIGWVVLLVMETRKVSITKINKLKQQLDELEVTLADEEASHQETLQMLEKAQERSEVQSRSSPVLDYLLEQDEGTLSVRRITNAEGKKVQVQVGIRANEKSHTIEVMTRPSKSKEEEEAKLTLVAFEVAKHQLNQIKQRGESGSTMYVGTSVE